MVEFNGCLSFKCYMNGKSTPWGIPVWWADDPCSASCWTLMFTWDVWWIQYRTLLDTMLWWRLVSVSWKVPLPLFWWLFFIHCTGKKQQHNWRKRKHTCAPQSAHAAKAGQKKWEEPQPRRWSLGGSSSDKMKILLRHYGKTRGQRYCQQNTTATMVRFTPEEKHQVITWFFFK